MFQEKATPLRESLFSKVAFSTAINSIKKETSTQVLSCEFDEFSGTFFDTTPWEASDFDGNQVV